MIIRTCMLLLLLSVLLTDCSSEQTRTLTASIDPRSSDLPTRRNLSRQLRQLGEVTIVYSAGSEALQSIAGQFEDGRGRIRFRAMPRQD